jgi:hypothetical protein
MSVTEQEFTDWKLHPVTKALMALLDLKRDEMRRAWEGGSYTDYVSETMALINVANIGTCRGYAFVQELEYEQLLERYDDEHIGIGSEGRSGSD